jgi:hypothetical protein
MEMWLKLILVIFLFVTFFPYQRSLDEPIDSYVNQVHKFSGLSPDHFYLFVDQMQIMKANIRSDPDVASKALYMGLENLREIGLYTQRADDMYEEELNAIADKLARTCEDVIQSTALVRGVRFLPRYLNDIVPETPDDADSFGPNYKKTGPLCPRGACRG